MMMQAMTPRAPAVWTPILTATIRSEPWHQAATENVNNAEKRESWLRAEPC